MINVHSVLDLEKVNIHILLISKVHCLACSCTSAFFNRKRMAGCILLEEEISSASL